MINILYILGGLVVAFIIAMFFEEPREYVTDAFQYIISFEWFGDIWEFITGMFENISEFSIMGLVFGLSSVGIIFALRNYMLNSFLQYMSPIQKIIWGGATYLVCFVAGYLIGKKMFDDE